MSINVLAQAEKVIVEATAATSLKNAAPITQVANVVRSGVAITIPPDMSIPLAIKVLESRMRYEDEKTVLKRELSCFPWDGAVAMTRVLDRKYGWAEQIMRVIETPFGDVKKKPELISVEIGPGQKVQVPWGRMNLPGVDGWIENGVTYSGDLVVFLLTAEVKRKHEATITALFDEIEQETKTNSIYKGRAIKIRFLDNDGERIPLPIPEFIDAERIDETALVYSDDVMDLVQTNLFTPILRAKECIAAGIQLKRGVLLGGKYGTGKTLAASIASKYAVQAGLTYVYVPRANELSYALAFAHQYQNPASVVFCEDIDRVTSGERSVRMDDILNMLDGIDSKNANVMTILTTNEIEKMNPAMLRPGRLDAVIEVTPPDARAVEKLLRLYGRGTIHPETDLTAAGKLLAGQIPAIVAEVVKRAKLAQIRHNAPGVPVSEITEIAVLSAAKSIQSQSELIERLIEANKPKAADPLSHAFAQVINDSDNGRFYSIVDHAEDEYGLPRKKA